MKSYATPTVRIPNLRFKQYTTPWHDTQLGALLQAELREIDKPTKNYLALGIRSHFNGIFHRANSDPSKIAMDKLYTVRAGDLIVNITFAWEGAIAIATKADEGGLVSHRFPTYRFVTDQVVGEFFRYVFPTERFKYNLGLASPGGAGRNRVLNKSDFLKISVSIPEIDEQKMIAGFLLTVDDKIACLQNKVKHLKLYKMGLVQAIFSHKLSFKDDNGNSYPSWQVSKLGDIAQFSKGKGVAKNDIVEGGITPCIRYGELYTRYNEVITKAYSATNISPDKLVMGKVNDVVIPASGETNIDIATASCLQQNGVALGGDINIIRSEQNGVFLAYYLNNIQKNHIARLAQGNSVVHLYSSQLSSLTLTLPSAEEQQKIANLLVSIDEKINLEISKLSQAYIFKKALLQRMFV